MADDPPKHAEPPGPPVRWETVKRSWDEGGQLVSEVVTVTTETDNSPTPPERRTGFYL